MHLICAITGHQRSRKRARATVSFSGWKSVCRYCDQAMVRVAPGRWLLETAAPQQVAETD